MNTDIRQLIDLKKVDTLLEGFNQSTGFVTAILDLEGNVLSKSGWRPLCAEFHRINPETSKRCTFSDTVLANKMGKGKKYHAYRCLNGLMDVAVPLKINGEHVANLFSGQFFFEEPDVEFFRKQAAAFGFDEKIYLDALSKVPVVSEEKVKAAMDFLLNMTEFISDLAIQKLEQAELNQDLKDSEEKFKSIFESANVGKSITLPTGEIDVNQAFCDILGYSHEELENKKWQDLTPEEDIPTIQAFTNPLLKGEKDSVRFEKRYFCKKGTYIWADVSTSIRRDKNGKPLHFITTIIDITEHKQAETEILQQQYYLNKAQEIGSIGTWELDLIKNELIWTKQNYKNFGVPLGTPLAYEIFLECIHPDDRDYVNKEWRAAINGKPYDIEHRLIVDGEVRWIREKADIEFDDNNKAIRAIGFAQDITERKNHEKALKDEKDRIRTILDMVGDPIFVKDNQHRITMANQAFFEMFATDEKSALGKTLAESVPENEKNHFLQVDKNVLDTGIQDLREEELTINNETKTIVTKKIRFTDNSGNNFLVGSIHDITERKQAEKNIIESEKQYRSLFENMNAGFVLFEMIQNEQGTPVDLIIIAANEGFEKTTGLNLKDAVGQHLTEVLPGIEKDEADWIGTYSKVALTGKATQFEQGSELLGYYYSVSAFQAGPKQCAVTFVDVTERRKAEELNRKSAERANMQRSLIAQLTFEESIVNSNIDDALKTLTTKLAATLQVDRVSVWLLSEDDKFLQRRMLYDATFGLDSQIDVLNTDDIPSYFEALRKDSQVDADDAHNDPRTKELTDNYFIPLQISSLLDSAIQQDGRLIGVLSAEHRGSVRQWHADEESFLSAVTNLVAQLFTNAERKQAEEKLRESESRYRKIYEDGANGMVMAGKNFEFLMANRTFCEMTGYQEEELQQLTFSDITHPDNSAKDIPQVKKIIAGEIDVYRTEKRYRKKDGQTFWAQLTVSPINDSNGQFLYFVGIIVNVTERKNAEMKLTDSEERLRLATEQSNVAVWEYDFNSNSMSRSQNHDKLYGLEWQSKWDINTFLNATHSEDREYSNNFIQNSVAPGGPDNYSFDFRVVFPGNSIRWLTVNGRVIERNKSGQGIRVRGTLTDITEQKNAELDLTRMSRIMKNSQEIAHLGSFEFVAATQATIWSEEEYRIYGLDPNGPSPEYHVMLEKCIHPDDAKLLHDTFMAAMQNQGVYELEHRIVRPDGSVRWVFDKANPYFDEHGNLLRYVGATLDTTDRKRLQEELEILNAELEKKVEQRTALLEASNKELEAFSYSVSHDLRAPLRHINGYVDLLNQQFKDELPEKAHHYLGTISGASSQMGILIDDLLQYSRTGRKEIRKSEIDLNALVKEVLEELKTLKKGRKITWDIQELPRVYGDYTLLKLVWTNLLDNAVKYTRNQPTAQISVAFKEEGKDFVFWVCDNGVGFDMKYAHKLFGVFQRLHSQAEFEGTGIGLANVQRIIHKHMGRVWAEAKPGKGATFYFSLPLNREEIL